MNPIDTFLSALRSRPAPPPARSGADWAARCPAHDDDQPSLSVREGDGGRVLVNCHAGCETSAVVAALGMTMADLFPKQGEGRAPGAPPPRTAKGGAGPTARRRQRLGRISERYDYRTADGALAFQVVRYEPKDFRQRHPDGSGGWAWGRGGHPPILYRLPEVLEAAAEGRTVFVVEGEKDADALAALEGPDGRPLAATCNCGGASRDDQRPKWRADLHAPPLEGAHVVVLPDNDGAGHAHAGAVAASLVGLALSVRVVHLPGLPEKGDVSDWLEAGGDVDGLRDAVRRAEPYEAGAGREEPEAPYTADTFRGDLGDAEGRAAERRAAELTGVVADAEPRWLPVICGLLDARGARARWLRDWKADVRAQRKFADVTEPDPTEQRASAPLKSLKGGSLHAALSARLRAAVKAFARDPGEALYRYDADRGHYVGPCGKWVGQRVRAELVEADALDLFSKRKVEAVEYDLLTTAPPLWDRPPSDRLCLENGVFDLGTGKLEPHGPARWRSTFGLPISYDPDADPAAPAWTAYLDGILPDDAGAPWGFELVRWLLTPASGRRPALLLYGRGNDGKSTFTRLLRSVLGGDNGASVSAASLHALTSDRFALADLYGAVLNVCADLPNEPLAPAAVARFKEITGGDFVRAERKYGDGFTFAPFAHLVFSSNHPLQTKAGADPAFWTRWIAVPFDRSRIERHRPEDDIRAELLAPRALSDLLAAALSCGDADGRPPALTPSMVACLDSMRRPGGTHPAPDACGGDGRPGAAPGARVSPPANNFPQTGQTGHPPPVSQTDGVRKVVGEPGLDPEPGSDLEAGDW